MSILRPSNASNSVTVPRSWISGVSAFTSTMGSRRREAAMASRSFMCSFSRIRNASTSAWKVLRSTTFGALSSSFMLSFPPYVESQRITFKISGVCRNTTFLSFAENLSRQTSAASHC